MGRGGSVGVRAGGLVGVRPLPRLHLLTLPHPAAPPATVGCTVEHEDPREIQQKIDDGDIVPPEA